jgi:hypothetical protein
VVSRPGTFALRECWYKCISRDVKQLRMETEFRVHPVTDRLWILSDLFGQEA